MSSMSRPISVLVLALLIASMFSLISVRLANANPSGSNVIFQEDFESYAPGTFPSAGGWEIMWNGRGDEYQVITDATSVSGSKSLKLEGVWGWSAVVRRKFSYATDVIGYEVYVKVDGYGKGQDTAKVGFFNRHAGSERWAGEGYYGWVFFTSDGKITAGGKVLQTYRPNTWYKVRVIYNTVTRKFNVWINDRLRGENLEARDPGKPNAISLESGWATVKSYFDDVKVIEVTETETETVTNLITNIWVDRDCGSTYQVGDKIIIYFKVNRKAYVRIIDEFPDGSTKELGSGWVEANKVYPINGVMGEPAGYRIFHIYAKDEYGNTAHDQCYVKVTEKEWPDLTVESYSYSPDQPIEGNDVNFDITVENIGTAEANDFNFLAKIDGEKVFETHLDSLSNDAVRHISFSWRAVKGRHKVDLIVDPQNSVDESNEDNNAKTIYIQVKEKENNPPVAYIDSVTPNPAKSGEIVRFRGHGDDPDGDEIVAYAWRSNIDGFLSNKKEFSTNKLTPGKHTIWFMVKDSKGKWSEPAKYTLEVKEKENRPPIASFTFSPSSPVVNQPVTFDASQSYDPDGSIVSYQWSFGDGSTGSGVKVQHTYSKPGSYTVTLTVSDDDGANSSTSRTVEAAAASTATITITETHTPTTTSSTTERPLSKEKLLKLLEERREFYEKISEVLDPKKVTTKVMEEYGRLYQGMLKDLIDVGISAAKSEDIEASKGLMEMSEKAVEKIDKMGKLSLLQDYLIGYDTSKIRDHIDQMQNLINEEIEYVKKGDVKSLNRVYEKEDDIRILLLNEAGNLLEQISNLKERKETTPEISVRKTYKLEKGKTVEFKVHVPDEAEHFCLDITQVKKSFLNLGFTGKYKVEISYIGGILAKGEISEIERICIDDATFYATRQVWKKERIDSTVTVKVTCTQLPTRFLWWWSYNPEVYININMRQKSVNVYPTPYDIYVYKALKGPLTALRTQIEKESELRKLVLKTVGG